MGSVDGVEVLVESTVASNHVKDGSVAHLVLNVLLLSWLMTESSLGPMIESVWVCLFLVHLVLSSGLTLELIKY